MIARSVLGRTGIEVSLLGLGGVFLASDSASELDVKSAVDGALKAGVNYIDTAPMYGDSEAVLGRVLDGRNEPLIMSTKLGGRPSPFDPRDVRALRGSFDESLRLLGRDYIDILFIHEPDRPGEYDWWTDRKDLRGPVLDVVRTLKDEGRIGHVGLGGTTAYEIVDLIETDIFDVVLTAFNYSLLWREAERYLIPAAASRGIGVVIGSPLQQGALSRRYDLDSDRLRWLSPPRREQLRALYGFADRAGIPIPELALRFVISNPAVHCVLTGARSPAEVSSSVAAVNRGPLDDASLAELDDIAAMVPLRPFEEPSSLPLGSDYRGPGPMR